MRSKPNPVFQLLDKDYHETFDRHRPDPSDFYDLVASQLPRGWEISRKGIWFHCGSAMNVQPRQGWKIHVSTIPIEARETLRRVLTVLFKQPRANFKFAMDIPTLLLLNGKNWPRGGSGKFITIYPSHNDLFVELIEELRTATEGLRGPYVLSDHRYKESEVIYYRYGGMTLEEVLDVKGERIPVVADCDGRKIPDQRLAYPNTPSWVPPPFPSHEIPPHTEGESLTLKGERYQIQEVLSFSNAGGVYRATDRNNGETVIIKEARPHVYAGLEGCDAVELLKKEHRLLTLLADTGISPRPVDLFQDWDHWFLVEEYIQGISMTEHSAAHSVLLRTRPVGQDYVAWYEAFRDFCVSLVRIISVLHAHNIVFSDLSPSNLIVCEGKTELKLIDFEGAYQPGTDRPSGLYTPGFVSQRRLSGSAAAFEDDYYSAGAALLAYLFPVNGLFHLKPEAKHEILAALQRDTNLPQCIAGMILAFLQIDGQRPETAATVEMLRSAPAYAPPTTADLCTADGAELGSVIDGIVTHLDHEASYSRRDRLFPADAKVFSTNPLSLAYGAAGVAYALHRITREFPKRVVDWMLQHSIGPEAYPPGLYTGLAGIAWALLEMGTRQEAESIFVRSLDHPLLFESPELFYGTAGWGMASLRFFLETQDELYLHAATRAGAFLLETSMVEKCGRHWMGHDKPMLGLAHGSSGIALFLLYLYLATGEQSFLVAGQEALEFDLGFANETKDGGLSWRSSMDAASPLYPYWRVGSAGIGVVTLRFHRLLDEPRYRSVLEKIFIDTDRKYAVLPGLFMGLSGLGEFLLDMHEFLKEQKYLESAHKVAQGILPFQVHRTGVAFPGEMLSRLCCDYGTGSAGVALFLNRLHGRPKGSFMLDALFTPQLDLNTDLQEEIGDLKRP